VGDVAASAAAGRAAAEKVAGFLSHEVPVTAEAVAAIESIGGKARMVVSDLAI